MRSLSRVNTNLLRWAFLHKSKLLCSLLNYGNVVSAKRITSVSYSRFLKVWYQRLLACTDFWRNALFPQKLPHTSPS
jgi:hypothetical protein